MVTTPLPAGERAPEPAVTVVVCTTGDPGRMPLLSQRLSDVLDDGDDVEVLLIDNSAQGGLSVPDARIRVERCDVPGLSRARALACELASGEVLVFTDDDVEFGPAWPMTMARPLLDGVWDAAAAPVRLGPEFDDLESTLARQWLAEANLEEPVRLVGAGMAFHRSVLHLGRWDERLGAGRADFAFGEETLFELMLKERGAAVGLVREAGVVHHPDPSRATNDHFLRIAWQKGLSDAYIGYHWWGESLARPRLREWRRRARLRLYRLRRRPRDVLDEHELRLAESVGVAAGYAMLQREPRTYLPRLGFTRTGSADTGTRGNAEGVY
ncbi:glycosyltransferase family 2 protein [Humibacter sp.]|uniref:glycosyltransferase family 2 protein n=1 Tax=Humibacter sp. TaxID=1940291 RepID=UPI003F80B485